MAEERNTYPISRYIGTFPSGSWEFVREFTGTYREALILAEALQKENGEYDYRIWDCREEAS